MTRTPVHHDLNLNKSLLAAVPLAHSKSPAWRAGIGVASNGARAPLDFQQIASGFRMSHLLKSVRFLFY